jgi:radical SAM protein with 4Fe4S-binding SPASM domain
MSEIKPSSGVNDRVKLADVLPLKTPFTLNIFPTNICNFKCNYCAQSLGSKWLYKEYNFKKETMSYDILKLVMEQAKYFDNKFKLVSMMGHGEPLVNPRLPEMINLVKQADIAERIDIITNASLLTKQKSRELIDAGLDVIRISLQGITSEKYKSISKIKLNYDEFIDNISYFYTLSRNKCKVFVKVLDVSLDYGEEEQFYKKFDKITDRMFVEKVKPVYDGVAYKENVEEVRTDRYGNIHEKRYVCPQPLYMLSIWPSGDVAPCDAIYKANYLGNVKDSILIDMWNSISLKNFRIMQLKKLRLQHAECKRCCAPDDVSHIEDILDDTSNDIIKRL